MNVPEKGDAVYGQEATISRLQASACDGFVARTMNRFMSGTLAECAADRLSASGLSPIGDGAKTRCERGCNDVNIHSSVGFAIPQRAKHSSPFSS
jgi:hypothetical protein